MTTSIQAESSDVGRQFYDRFRNACRVGDGEAFSDLEAWVRENVPPCADCGAHHAPLISAWMHNPARCGVCDGIHAPSAWCPSPSVKGVVQYTGSDAGSLQYADPTYPGVWAVMRYKPGDVRLEEN